jgi:hypothetical protein
LALSASAPPVVPDGVTVSHAWSELACQGTLVRCSELRTFTLRESTERAGDGSDENATPAASTTIRLASRLKVTGRSSLTATPRTVAVSFNSPV